LFYNIGIFILFIMVVSCLLVYKYKGKLTKEELEIKEKEKQYYILSKIKNYQSAKLQAQQQLITGLPQWETEYDIHYKQNI
jgi:hypothetical protein